MAIATTNGQVLDLSKMRIKHRLHETRPADEVIARRMVPADMDPAEIARPQNWVLHVTLAEKSTMKGLAAAILAASDADLD
ncbi:MAG: hypothetical protein EOS27_14265 [Mesorhizobium sp.]|nr:MAG: hypothetical protein EOS27_14265 [Mesorhizobium sp.]